ncbi:MAG: metallophosphoesterase [Candidatus Staskawiczbacteria bacterium]|nr:metallophosphoesterase [Candidatus Staskawiczbacteria bacterium]
MKIAVVSDTHDNWGNFEKAIDWVKKEKISLILHCGDIASQETIDKAVKYFSGGEIKFVKGNADYELDLPEKMELELNGKKISFCHFPNVAKKLAQSGEFDLVFYGHTHRPWDEKVACPELSRRRECHMINPGELAGHFYMASFAVYDTETGKLELKILEKL